MADMIRVSVPENVSVDYLLQAYLDVFTRFYPNFDEWFIQKVVPNLGTTRRIFLANIGKEIAGICIVKNCPNKIEYAFNGFLEPKDISHKSIECLEVLSCQ